MAHGWGGRQGRDPDGMLSGWARLQTTLHVLGHLCLCPLCLGGENNTAKATWCQSPHQNATAAAQAPFLSLADGEWNKLQKDGGFVMTCPHQICPLCQSIMLLLFGMPLGWGWGRRLSIIVGVTKRQQKHYWHVF